MFRTPRRRVPYVIAVAEHETGEYIRQSRDYAQALQGKSYDVSYLQVQGKNHYNILDAFLDFSHPWVMRSMNRCSGQSRLKGAGGQGNARRRADRRVRPNGRRTASCRIVS